MAALQALFMSSVGLVAGLTATVAAAATPDRVWGSYYGGGSELDAAIAVDPHGDVYVVGHTSADDGIATPGAHKTVRQGFDTYIIKFDAGGARLWGTYFGGTGTDLPAAIVADEGGVVIVGRTASPGSISTPGAHQPVAGGALDGFVARFSADGSQVWGTYLGSNWDDEALALAVDAQGSLIVGGRASGPLPGLGTPGAHQPSISESGEEDDGFVARFDAAGQIVWGTYYGGARDDQVLSVAPGPDGAVYVVGATRSIGGIASAGAHDETLARDDDIDEVVDTRDAFLVRLGDDGARVWGTYLGDLGEDGLTGVVALPEGGLIAGGATTSKDGMATPGAFQTAFASAESWYGDGLLTRFDADGVRVWGTYVGGSSVDQLEAIARDASGAIYLLGMTQSVGLATPDAFATAPGGLADGYLARFTPGGARTWATYHGGEAGELPGGFAVAGDRIYVSGSTHSATGIATPGAHLEQLPDFGPYGYLVRFTQGAGAPCEVPDVCLSGLCVDGVCCDQPCGGGVEDCQACSVALGAAVDGECSPLAADVVCRPADGVCDAPELCPGDAGLCPDDAALPDGEPCGGGVCSAGACEPASSSSDGDTTGPPTSGEATSGEVTSAEATAAATEPVPGDSTGAAESVTGGVVTSGHGSTGGTSGSPGDGEGGCACRQTSGRGLAAPFGALVLAVAARRRRPRRPVRGG